MKRLFFFSFWFLFPFLMWSQAQPNRKTQTIVVSAEKVYFDFGKYDLRPDADSVLQVVRQQIMGKSGLRVRITAHTDAIGTQAANQRLSEQRAERVQAFLQAAGIPDSLIYVEAQGENAHVASNDAEPNRQLNRRATISIVQEVPLLLFKGIITDKKTGAGLAATVFLRGKTLYDSLQTAPDGTFEKWLPPNTILSITAYADCYFPNDKMIKAQATTNGNLTLKPLEKGSKWAIPNLYFVGNEATLLPQSEPSLEQLLGFMRKNNCFSIEIAGHINQPNRPKVNRESWNFKLSVARAKRIYDFLLENGIPSDRMTYQGYGNWQMVYPQARSEAEQAANRRVEINIAERLQAEKQ